MFCTIVDHIKWTHKKFTKALLAAFLHTFHSKGRIKNSKMFEKFIKTVVDCDLTLFWISQRKNSMQSVKNEKKTQFCLHVMFGQFYYKKFIASSGKENMDLRLKKKTDWYTNFRFVFGNIPLNDLHIPNEMGMNSITLVRLNSIIGSMYRFESPDATLPIMLSCNDYK